MPSFNTGSALADPLGLRTDQLPGRGWGLDVGAHVYPVRGRRFALGVGAEIVRASGSKAPDPEDAPRPAIPPSRRASRRWCRRCRSTSAPSRGWSYIGGGLAFIRRATGDVDAEVADWPRLTGIHYGGGARWFISPHVAFMFDLRFYRIPEQAAEGTEVPFQPKSRLFLMTAGLSFKYDCTGLPRLRRRDPRGTSSWRGRTRAAPARPAPRPSCWRRPAPFCWRRKPWPGAVVDVRRVRLPELLHLGVGRIDGRVDAGVVAAVEARAPAP